MPASYIVLHTVQSKSQLAKTRTARSRLSLNILWQLINYFTPTLHTHGSVLCGPISRRKRRTLQALAKKCRCQGNSYQLPPFLCSLRDLYMSVIVLSVSSVCTKMSTKWRVVLTECALLAADSHCSVLSAQCLIGSHQLASDAFCFKTRHSKGY